MTAIGYMPDEPTWHDGDVVQTQMPYDDYPVTLVRMSGSWVAVLPDQPVRLTAARTDAEITSWLGEEAEVKVRQDHQLADPRSERTYCVWCGDVIHQDQ